MYNEQILALMIEHEIDYPQAAMKLLDIEENQYEIIVTEEDIQKHILSSSPNEIDCTEEILF